MSGCPHFFPVMQETLAWVLGEYGYLSSVLSLDSLIDGMASLLSGSTAKIGGGLASTRRLVLSALMKMVAQFGSCPASAATIIDAYTKSSDPDAQKRCLEFQTILTTAPHLLREVFPVDASLEDMDVGMNLNFMDAFVGDAISNGARPYQKPEGDDDEEFNITVTQTSSAFKMTPYEKPSEKTFGQGAMQGMGSSNMGVAGTPNVTLPPGAAAGAVASPVQQPINPGEPQLQLRHTANVWGKKAPPAQVPPATTPSTSSFASPVPAAAPSGYGGFGGNAPIAAAPVAAVKTAEQLEKERMAAALFGGISGAPPPPPPAPTPAPPARTQPVATTQPASLAIPSATLAASAPQPSPVASAAQVSQAVTAAPEVDLLGFDSATTSTTATVDMLSPTVLMDEPAHVPSAEPPAPTPAPAPAQAPVSDDPCKLFMCTVCFCLIPQSNN